MALALNPTVGRAYGALARLHESNWREAEARQSYGRAYQLSPNDSDVLTDFAVFKFRTDQYEDAIEIGHQLAAVNPGFGHGVLAMMLMSAGGNDAAAAAFGEAVAFSPAGPLWHMWLGLVEAARGNEAKALEELRLSESLSGDDFVAPADLAARAHGYGRLGRPEDAD